VAATHGTIVVVEDDAHISDLVAMYLRRDGFQVLQTTDGSVALTHATTPGVRLVVVDIGLPGEMDGFEICRRLRRQGDVPVVMLTARDDELDRVLGLELGADDYVTKPFSARELVARVHAILRRTALPEAGTGAAARPGPGPDERHPVHVVGDVTVDAARRDVTTPTGPVALTAREFDLLAYLVTNRGLALSRRQLLDGVWGPDWIGDERTVDVHVRQLRKKLGDALPLATLWGVGYRLD
jgi:DNA-binding response OmpR family regulator